MFDHLTDAQRKALRRMVTLWVNEGWDVPPYQPEQYDIIEALGITNADTYYNVDRPNPGADEAPV